MKYLVAFSRGSFIQTETFAEVLEGPEQITINDIKTWENYFNKDMIYFTGTGKVISFSRISEEK